MALPSGRGETRVRRRGLTRTRREGSGRQRCARTSSGGSFAVWEKHACGFACTGASVVRYGGRVNASCAGDFGAARARCVSRHGPVGAFEQKVTVLNFGC